MSNDFVSSQLASDLVSLGSCRGRSLGSAEQVMRTEAPGLPFLPEPVAFPPDLGHTAVVQQPVQDRRGDDSVAQDLAHSPKPWLDVRMMLPSSFRRSFSSVWRFIARFQEEW